MVRESEYTLERMRAAARIRGALIAMNSDDLSGAELHLAVATAHLQEAQRLQDSRAVLAR